MVLFCQWWSEPARMIQKPVNANPGLTVNQSINFSCIKMFFSYDILYSLILLN